MRYGVNNEGNIYVDVKTAPQTSQRVKYLSQFRPVAVFKILNSAACLSELSVILRKPLSLISFGINTEIFHPFPTKI
jgi:hypothetical protein